jgi:hypothetical protein
MISNRVIELPDISVVACGQDIDVENGLYLNMKLDLYLIRSHNGSAVKRNGEEKMNIAKNMEFIFVAAVVVATSLANAFAAPAAPLEVAAKSTVAKAPIATVVVVGKRLKRIV